MSNTRAEQIQDALPSDCKFTNRQMRELRRMLDAEVPVLERVDCGSGSLYGVCGKCGRGHGLVVFRGSEQEARRKFRSEYLCTPTSAEPCSPCPFCGEVDVRLIHATPGSPAWSVCCSMCNAIGSFDADRIEAVRLWNQRANTTGEAALPARKDA